MCVCVCVGGGSCTVHKALLLLLTLSVALATLDCLEGSGVVKGEEIVHGGRMGVSANSTHHLEHEITFKP